MRAADQSRSCVRLHIGRVGLDTERQLRASGVASMPPSRQWGNYGRQRGVAIRRAQGEEAAPVRAELPPRARRIHSIAIPAKWKTFRQGFAAVVDAKASNSLSMARRLGCGCLLLDRARFCAPRHRPNPERKAKVNVALGRVRVNRGSWSRTEESFYHRTASNHWDHHLQTVVCFPLPGGPGCCWMYDPDPGSFLVLPSEPPSMAAKGTSGYKFPPPEQGQR